MSTNGERTRGHRSVLERLAARALDEVTVQLEARGAISLLGAEIPAMGASCGTCESSTCPREMAQAVHADTFTRRYVLYDRLAQSRVRHHLPQSMNHLALLANNLISNRELEMEFHIFHSHEPVLR